MTIQKYLHKIIAITAAGAMLLAMLTPASAVGLGEQPIVEQPGARQARISRSGSMQDVFTAQVADALVRCQIVTLAKEQLGTPYSWGGKTPGGFDCSGFVYYVFTQMGFAINRTASSQVLHGEEVQQEALIPGDLVFFKNTYRGAGSYSHVGIYVGEGMFIHSSNSGVVIEDLTDGYYARHYQTARRLIGCWEG